MHISKYHIIHLNTYIHFTVKNKSIKISKQRKTECSPLRSGIRQKSPFTPLLYNILLAVLASAVRGQKKKKKK